MCPKPAPIMGTDVTSIQRRNALHRAQTLEPPTKIASRLLASPAFRADVLRSAHRHIARPFDGRELSALVIQDVWKRWQGANEALVDHVVMSALAASTSARRTLELSIEFALQQAKEAERETLAECAEVVR